MIWIDVVFCVGVAVATAAGVFVLVTEMGTLASAPAASQPAAVAPPRSDATRPDSAATRSGRAPARAEANAIVRAAPIQILLR